MQSFQQNHHIIFHALVTLKLLVWFISRLVACSARIVVDTQTNKQAHRPITATLAAHARRGLMKGTSKVQTLGALYACAQLIDGLGHVTWSATYLPANRLASCMIVSGFRAALDLDTYHLCNLIRPRCAEHAKLMQASAHYAY